MNTVYYLLLEGCIEISKNQTVQVGLRFYKSQQPVFYSYVPPHRVLRKTENMCVCMCVHTCTCTRYWPLAAKSQNEYSILLLIKKRFLRHRIIQHHKLQNSVIFFLRKHDNDALPILANHTQIKAHTTVSVNSIWQWHSPHTGMLVTKYSHFKLRESIALVLFAAHTAQGKHQVVTKASINIRHC